MELNQSQKEALTQLLKEALFYWEAHLMKSKVELAEACGYWKVHKSGTKNRTRTLDRYLDPEKLPNNPRWQEVIKTVRFVQKQPLDRECKINLETKTNRWIEEIMRQNNT